MVLQHRTVNGTKETLRPDLRPVLFPSVAMVHGRAPLADPSIGCDRHVRLDYLIAQHIRHLQRDCGRGNDLVERVAVPFEELDLTEAQSQNLIAADGLQKAPQGLSLKSVGHDGEFGDRPLKPEHSEQVRSAQDSQSIQSVVPEVGIVSELLKGLQREATLDGRILLPQRFLQLLYQVAKPDWVLLILRTAPMGRLVKREAWRPLDASQFRQ